MNGETDSATAALAGLGAHSETRVAITIGTEHFRTGLITLSVGGDGAVEVLQRRAGQETRYTASWDAARVEALGRELAGLGACRVAPVPGDREPDDVPVTVTVTTGDAVACRASGWHGDRYQSKDLDALIRRFDAVVTEVSGGALPFGAKGR